MHIPEAGRVSKHGEEACVPRTSEAGKEGTALGIQEHYRTPVKVRLCAGGAFNVFCPL